MPKLTIIMPVYNAGSFLAECVDSILSQTFTDFDFLIYNDGSTDQSRNIIDTYQDARIKATHSHENKGYVYWLNIGLSQAKGDYIARMDADDISHPERLRKQIEFLESNQDVGACGTQLSIIGSGNQIKKPVSDQEIRWWFFKGTPLAHPSVMMRSSVVRANKLLYNPELRPAEDYDMWWRMAAFTKLHNLDEVLLQYRIHEQQESTSKQALQWMNHQTSKQAFSLYLGIDDSKYYAEWTYNLFSGLLQNNANTLHNTHRFFSDLIMSRKAVEYFKEQSIETKYLEIMLNQLINLKSFKPSLIPLVLSSRFRHALSKADVTLFKFVLKCCLRWQTRENQ